MEFSILILAYLCLNSTLNIMNRWALGIYGFTFPILLTICHMMFAFIVLLPVMVANTKLQHKATLKRQYKGLVCIGVFMALNVSLNNLSLVQISLSLNQVIRCEADPFRLYKAIRTPLLCNQDSTILALTSLHICTLSVQQIGGGGCDFLCCVLVAVRPDAACIDSVTTRMYQR